MSLTITDRALREASKRRIQPQLILEIDGVDTLFGAVEISRLIRIGDPGLLIGDSWRIGGLIRVENQASVISIEGSGTSINQQLQPDKGSVSSVSSIAVNLIDKNLIMSELISPGLVIPDILGAKAILWMGFKDTAFKQDYVPIFSGIIDDVMSGPGLVTLNLSHPEQLKRQDIFNPIALVIDGSLDSSQTTIPLLDASELPLPVMGPDGTYDESLRFYIRVEDEFIRYEGIAGNTLTSCTRGFFGSLAVAHTVDTDPITAQSVVSFEDTAVNIALKLMLSGFNDFYKKDFPINQYLHPTPSENVPNSVYFDNTDLNRDFGVTEGDFVTITGATNSENNCELKAIQEIVTTEAGSYIVIAGVDFIEESETTAVISFRSRFDTWGIGLGMTPDQVDVNEHIFWNNFQLANYSYRFVIQDAINGKDFLDKEVYLPIGAYSIPRGGRCSMGYHVGPVVRGELKTINRSNIKNPDKIKLRRTISKNFYNTIVYKFEQNPINEKYLAGNIQLSAESQNQIKVGLKVFAISSAGMRRNLDGQGTAVRISERYLGRYQFAAESFEAVGLFFKDGYTVESGDVVLFDFDGLNITNTKDGTRTKPPKLFSVINKTTNLSTGDTTLSLTDTNFDETERYGGISPSSNIVSGTTTSLLIEDSYGSLFPGNEYKKWIDYQGLPIRVHSPDYSFDETVTFWRVDSGNKYRLQLDPATPLSVPPDAGFIIDIADYPTSTDPAVNGLYKAVHTFWGPTVPIVDDGNNTTSIFEVDGAQIGKFIKGSIVRVHNETFSVLSEELVILDVTGNLITVDGDFGFVPDADCVADSMNFPDGGTTYRFF